MIFHASTNYYLLFQYFNCIQDEEKNHRLFRGKNVKNIENHSMQFMVWRYSGKSRTIIEFISTLVITILIQYYFQYAQNMNDDTMNKVDDILNLQKEYLKQTSNAS